MEHDDAREVNLHQIAGYLFAIAVRPSVIGGVQKA
jgi:hypothetical protein